MIQINNRKLEFIFFDVSLFNPFNENNNRILTLLLLLPQNVHKNHFCMSLLIYNIVYEQYALYHRRSQMFTV